jgi:type VI secretion system secreted protein VgrG
MIERAALSCDGIDVSSLVGVSGKEAMGALPAFRVDVTSPDSAVDLKGLLGQDAALALGDEGGAVRRMPLSVRRCRYVGPSRDGHRYVLELSSRLHMLELRSGHRIWQNRTAQQIIAELLTDLGVASDETVWRLARRYAERTYSVQFAETEWEHVSRLLGEEGINAWFDETAEGKPRLIFGDDTSSHESIPGDKHVRFEDASGLGQSSSSLYGLELSHRLAHDAVYLRDFDVRQPDRLVEAAAGTGGLEHYEFPARPPNAEAAQARAAVRLEQLRRLAVHARGRSGNVRLRPGRVLSLEGAADAHFTRDYLVVEVEHELRQATPEEPAGRPYSNRVLMVPFGEGQMYRPAPVSSRPRIDGLETAVVTGPAGEEIHVDDLGSVKLRFRWDRSGIVDDKSSRWVRCLEPSMLGAMLLPRVGWEVPVAYVDGHPDEPFVLGRLYNSASRLPYALPGRKASSTLQSATSPSDGTTQEIRLADDAGGMQAFIHATKDQSVSVGGTHTETVSANKTHDVKKSSVVTVSSQAVSIGGSQSVVVGADLSLIVDGSRAETIGGSESIGVTGSYHLTSGAYTEAIGGSYALRCNQANTVVQGGYSELVGGALLITAGLGTNQSCAAARSETVGGVRAITAGAVCAERVMGAKVIAAGASSDTAPEIVTSVGGVGLVQVGGAASLSAGGRLAFEAPAITVKAGGGITAKGGATLEIGGSVKPSGGKLKLDTSSVKKKVKSDVGA